MHRDEDRITADQAQRIQILYAFLKKETCVYDRLKIDYELVPTADNKATWCTTLHIGKFVSRSEPWRPEDWVFKSAQEAFVGLCKEIMDDVREEMEEVDRDIDGLKTRRLILERAMDSFAMTGGTGR